MDSINLIWALPMVLILGALVIYVNEQVEYCRHLKNIPIQDTITKDQADKCVETLMMYCNSHPGCEGCIYSKRSFRWWVCNINRPIDWKHSWENIFTKDDEH